MHYLRENNMELVLLKQKNNVTSIIQWPFLNKLDIHAPSAIHPYVEVQYKIEDIMIVL